MRNNLTPFTWTFVVLSTLLAMASHADEFIVDYDSSILGFVNHKRGIASGLIVDPLTYPSEYSANITLDASIESAKFSIRYNVKKLQVAGSEKLERWGQMVLEAGAARRPLKAPSKSRQKKIQKTVLSEKFMHAARYPQVRIKSLGMEALPEDSSKNPHTHKMSIEIEMHGEVVKATFPAQVILEEDRLTVDAAFPLNLSDFKIKPYSGFFGAVRFSDQFHVYMHFEAKRKEKPKEKPDPAP